MNLDSFANINIFKKAYEDGHKAAPQISALPYNKSAGEPMQAG